MFQLGQKYLVFGKVATYRGEVAALFTFSVDDEIGQLLRVFPQDVATVQPYQAPSEKAKK